MIKYKVLLGDFMQMQVVGEFLSKKEAETLGESFMCGDPYITYHIEKHNEEDYKKYLKQERKEKLENIWKKQMNGKL